MLPLRSRLAVPVGSVDGARALGLGAVLDVGRHSSFHFHRRAFSEPLRARGIRRNHDDRLNSVIELLTVLPFFKDRASRVRRDRTADANGQRMTTGCVLLRYCIIDTVVRAAALRPPRGARTCMSHATQFVMKFIDLCAASPESAHPRPRS